LAHSADARGPASAPRTRGPQTQKGRALVANWRAQERSLCGPTSITVVGGAARGAFPNRIRDGWLAPRLVLARAGLTPAMLRGESPHPDGAIQRGLGLWQLHELATINGFRSNTRFVRAATPWQHVRDEIKDILTMTDGFVIANFWRPALGQTGRGHHSPIGEYDAMTDEFLVVDVSPKYGPYWVSARALIEAMRVDTGDSRGRGYLSLRLPGRNGATRLQQPQALSDR
jgi:hypothetical protein